jgi:two-component system, LytTR family, response regulator
MFKTVIIEDDSFAREMLSDVLAKHSESYVVSAFFDSVKSAVRSLPALEPDLVFLDMELTDGKGFDILEKLVKINFEIIVTTQHDSYMLQAIKHSALDYLLKPVNTKSVAAALKRFENKMTESKATLKTNAPVHINKIILPMNEGLLLLNISNIIRLESDGAYTTFFTADGNKYLTSRTLATYEDQLIPQSFFRVHHSHLVNMNHISKYVKGEGGHVVMSDNSTVDVSRRKKDDFLRALNY